jgi:hypothetical protein
LVVLLSGSGRYSISEPEVAEELPDGRLIVGDYVYDTEGEERQP